MNNWDIFICHASEDKSSFVEPLSNALRLFGVNVWYDSFSLSIGDSLTRSIDQGLAKSKYGLVILSPAFLKKQWTEYELRGLTTKEMEGTKVIIPIWHNVTKKEIINFSPSLADKVAIIADDKTVLKVALAVIEVIRPDIFERIISKLAMKEIYNKSSREEIKPDDARKIKLAPIRHETLPDELIQRIRLVRASLLFCYPHSMEFWLDGFKRDSHPSKEVYEWERIASVLIEYVSMTPLKREQHELILPILLAFSGGTEPAQLKQSAVDLPDNALDVLFNIFMHKYPVYDIKEEIMSKKMEVSEKESQLDKEHFPNDVPDVLIEQILKEND